VPIALQEQARQFTAAADTLVASLDASSLPSLSHVPQATVKLAAAPLQGAHTHSA
jgi:hypothetical protein